MNAVAHPTQIVVLRDPSVRRHRLHTIGPILAFVEPLAVSERDLRVRIERREPRSRRPADPRARRVRMYAGAHDRA